MLYQRKITAEINQWLFKAVVLEPNKKLKQKMLEDYVSDYINKDIRAIGRIDNIARFIYIRICDKSRSQEVKEIVKMLEKTNGEKHL